MFIEQVFTHYLQPGHALSYAVYSLPFIMCDIHNFFLQYNVSRANCNKIIMLFTDGGEERARETQQNVEAHSTHMK